MRLECRLRGSFRSSIFIFMLIDGRRLETYYEIFTISGNIYLHSLVALETIGFTFQFFFVPYLCGSDFPMKWFLEHAFIKTSRMWMLVTIGQVSLKTWALVVPLFAVYFSCTVMAASPNKYAKPQTIASSHTPQISIFMLESGKKGQ